MVVGIAVTLLLVFVLVGLGWFLYWDAKQQKRKQPSGR